MRPTRQSWNITRGFTIEELADSDLPESLRGLQIDSLDFEFRSTGYYQPMSMYGGSDRLGWPAEGNEDRELISVKAESEDRELIDLNQRQIADALSFPAFMQRMNEQDL